MKQTTSLRGIIQIASCLLGVLLMGQPSVTTIGAAEPGKGYTYLGKLAPRHARDIQASNWSVGAETMDRDYTIYRNWCNFLGPLGAKQARLQSGWAKTETTPGVYEWAWLDDIVFDIAEQGVKPWICLCYGNPIYEGGGGTGLAGGLPTSPQALKAWDAYVAAVVERYMQHVDQWEIWNEPRTGRGKGADVYAEFAARTAQVVRDRQPKARFMLAAGGAFDAPFVKQMLTWLREHNQLSICNEVVYHPYAYNPDDSYGRAMELRKIIHSFSPNIVLRQNENGVPSRHGSFGAVSQYEWTELRQAKWATRRLLGDLGHDIPSSYFAICDMAYRVRKGGKDSDLRDDQKDLKVLVNSKGLLAINSDRTVHHAKLAYHAVQHITALFDSTLQRQQEFPAKVAGGAPASTFAVYGYRTANGQQLVTLWRSSDRPGKRPEMEAVKLALPNGSFKDPVWIDLVSGRVFDIDDALWEVDSDGCTFQNLPVYDAAIVVAERAMLGALRLAD